MFGLDTSTRTLRLRSRVYIATFDQHELSILDEGRVIDRHPSSIFPLHVIRSATSVPFADPGTTRP